MQRARQAGGDPDPGARRGTRPAPGKPGPQQGSAVTRTSPGCRGQEGGPRPRSPPGRREERPLPVSGHGLWLRRSPGRAGARLAGREPAGAKSEEQRARGADGALGPWCRPSGPGWTQRLQAPVADQSVTPVSPRRRRRDSGNRPREEPQPERLGTEAKQGRGHRVGDPLTRKQLWPQRRAMRRQLDTGPPGCSRLSRGDLLVAPGAVLLPPGSATASCCWGCAGGSAAGRDRGWGGGPGRPRGGSSGPAVPAQRLRPQDRGQECELMRVPVQGCTCPGHR